MTYEINNPNPNPNPPIKNKLCERPILVTMLLHNHFKLNGSIDNEGCICVLEEAKKRGI
jgi:hypothetical protein